MKNILLLSFIALFSWVCTFAQQQPPNAGFEEWEDVGTVVDEPVNWSSLKTSDGGEIINNGAPQVWEKSTDAHTGNYSVRLENKPQFGIIANGTVTTGRIHVHIPIDPELSSSFTVIGDDRWSQPCTDRPDSVAGYYKFYPQEDDKCQVKVLLHVGEGSIPAFDTEDNWVGSGAFISENKTVDQWTRFSAPINYDGDTRIPEYLLMICNIEEANEASEGSIAFYDDLELIYNESGIDDPDNVANQLYVNNGTIYLDKLPVDILRGASIKIATMMGQEVYNQPITSTSISYSASGITRGIYICTIVSDNRAFSAKLLLE